MTLKQALAANRWLRVQFACLIAVALCVPAIIVFTSAWVFLAFGVFALTGGACWVPARRLEKALEAARVASAQEAAELRTPRVPDAGPDQCPVCGGYGLAELAADDAFMDRGERARVVPWGRKRAHRDCAEFVPYVAPPHFERVEVEGHRVYCVCDKCERATTHPGARRWCKFCGFYRWAESREAAKAELIAHAKECPERPNARLLTDRSYREGGVVLNPSRVVLGPDGEAYVDCSPEGRWLWPDLKGRGK